MGEFMKYFIQDFGRCARALWDCVKDFLYFLYYFVNLGSVAEMIDDYKDEFTTWDWILVILANLVRLALILLALYGIFRFLKWLLRFRIPVRKYDELNKQVKTLQRDLLRANYEKDKLLAMKVGELGMNQEDIEKELKEGEEPEEGEGSEEVVPMLNRNTMDSPCVDPSESRFFRLTTVDNFYKTSYQPPQYDNDITLEQLCDRFRRFAASKLKLYYDLSMMRYFIASMGTARIVILQGISGTGKTSLAYAFGRFVNREASLCPVQPAWRERTELYGYYNEFTKKYTETEFLKAVYEANYIRDPQIVILDEMNIARVEYYFAEMLSILELPNKEDWHIDIVSAMWENDPVLIHDGIVRVPDNVWFIGTINNDDSTFAVADKVYDRAIPIDLDSRADVFECEPADSVNLSTDHLNALYDNAKKQYRLSDAMEKKLETLNDYLIKTFKLAFGNRILRQMHDYVPIFIACGGTEAEAVDFMVAKKVLRKFESLNLGFMKDELNKFEAYLDRLFGRDTMKICKEYVEYLKRNN